MEIVGHLIDGENVTENISTMPLTNPATGIQVSELAMASAEQTRSAIEAASSAYPSWRATPPAKRAQVMFRFKSLLEKNSTEIGYLIGREHGKIPHDAEGEVQRGIENVEFACFAPEILKGEFSKNVGPGIDSWSEFHPLGVVAGITPFNFPVMVPLWMYPLAIVCGNTFVLKPSEKDPSAALYVAQLAHEQRSQCGWIFGSRRHSRLAVIPPDTYAKFLCPRCLPTERAIRLTDLSDID